MFKAGFFCWQDVLERPDALPFSGGLNAEFFTEIKASVDALRHKDIHFFLERFPVSEQWRILGEFFTCATFFDIESTGLNTYQESITVIGCYHKNQLYSFVRGKNLSDFLTLLDDVSLLVSFNGSSFDTPFIREQFHIPHLPCPHLDLRWQSFHLNYSGSLKELERRLGVNRPQDLRSMRGYEAISLWWDYTHGKEQALTKLLRYCQADTLALYLVSARLLTERGYVLNSKTEQELWQLLD